MRYRAIIVIPAADQQTANEAALAFDPEGGAQTFTQGLSPDGAAPATHYWCSVAVDAERWNELLELRAAAFPSGLVVEWFEDAEPGRPARLLAELGLRPVEGIPGTEA